MRSERGQAAVLLVGVLLAVVIGGLFLGIYAGAVGAHSDQQRAADLAALAGARAMREAYPRVFELGSAADLEPRRLRGDRRGARPPRPAARNGSPERRRRLPERRRVRAGPDPRPRRGTDASCRATARAQ